MLPFLQNKAPYRLKRFVSKANYFDKYVDHTNLSDLHILFFSLVKKGYGSLNEVKEFDTPELIDIIEYESIMNDIENLVIEDSKNGNEN